MSISGSVRTLPFSGARVESQTTPPRRAWASAALACALLTGGGAGLLAQAAAPASSQDLLDPALRDLFHEALSGELAKEHVIAITRHHRIQGSRGYRDAAQYVIGQLRAYGYGAPGAADAAGTTTATTATDADVAAGGAAGAAPGSCSADHSPSAWIEAFVSDGRVVYQTWQSPSGWDIESAELRLSSPTGVPGGERIVGFPEIAMSVITYSNAGDVTAPLVWVGSGEREEDYAGKDVAGKFVLATGYGGAVHRLAVLKHGAAAVVCFLDDGRAADHPDMLAYTGIWPRTDELSRTTFGFNLTHRQGARLRDMLLAGQDVTLHGWVQGRGLEPYFMDVVCAVIPGSEHPEEELVFSAHLDHPKESANDNASGSGAILDMARTLKELIDSGRLPRPQRTLRFLWVPEWNGTMAYIDRHPELIGPELGGHVLANLNLDMVGENLELLHSRLILTRTPDSVPSCLNDVVQNMAQMVDAMDIRTPRGGASAFNWRMTPYSGGSDHMMFLDRKVPAIMFTHDPDYTHHTSEDTPDKVDPVELERCELIATGAAWLLANLDARQADELAGLVATRAIAAYGDTRREARATVKITNAGPEPVPRSPAYIVADQSLLSTAVRGMIAVDSVATFLDSPQSLELVHQHKRWLEAALGELRRNAFMTPDGKLPLGEATGEADGSEPLSPPASALLVPMRLSRGPLDFGLPESRLPPNDAAWYRSPAFTLNGDQRFELVNFIDGKRSVAWIAHELSTEFGPTSEEVVERYIADLVKVGVVAWK